MFMRKWPFLAIGLLLIGATAGAVGFASESRGAKRPQVIEVRPETPAAVDSSTASMNGISARIVAGDSDFPYLTLEFWFDTIPETATLLVIDAQSVTWDGQPVRLSSITTGAVANARVLIPNWKPGEHRLEISRFGHLPAPDAAGHVEETGGKWVDGTWLLNVNLEGATPSDPTGALALTDPGSANQDGYTVTEVSKQQGRWRITLQFDPGQRQWVSVPAFLRLPSGDFLIPDETSESGSTTTLSFAIPASVSRADLVVSAWVTERDGRDAFTLRRDSTGFWSSAEAGIEVVEDGALFGVTVARPGNEVFSAFGDPVLIDDAGNTYPLDWHRVGFGKSDPEQPHVIINGTSAARFIGPIDPRATTLQLVGGPGGALVSPQSLRGIPLELQ